MFEIDSFILKSYEFMTCRWFFGNNSKSYNIWHLFYKSNLFKNIKKRFHYLVMLALKFGYWPRMINLVEKLTQIDLGCFLILKSKLKLNFCVAQKFSSTSGICRIHRYNINVYNILHHWIMKMLKSNQNFQL